MGHSYKPTAITRVGFEYQDLVAAETLLNFYRESSKYQWVQVESSDPAFRAVDDVVACLADGRLELTQVKFAVDPDNPKTSLDWDWLLDAKPKGKSLLQHWAGPVIAHVDKGVLASACLKTDRRPDSAFSKSLSNHRVIYSKIEAAIRNRIVDQLGSVTSAKKFFANFKFLHSQPVLDDLEAKLWRRISTDTDRGGWALFQRQLKLWATQKDQPHPDGRIRHIHLQQAFSNERAKPLPQSFRVPKDYCVPDAEFAREFSRRVEYEDGVTVLWAPPGRGKSTFLSHFTTNTDPDRIVCVRHHYFLSLDDRSEGRFHFQAIARSLEAQLEEAIPDFVAGRKSLGETIESAAAKVAAVGKRLIVIVDGLDHVWREGRDREHAEELFDALTPILSATHVIIGTQKIEEKHLPAKLLASAPADGWIELPLMDHKAVQNWVASQCRARSLTLYCGAHASKVKALEAVSDAFYEISVGLPLHLIYSFEAAARAGNQVSPDTVRALPACPTGDIQDYYTRFLSQLSVRGKSILHVLAGLNFSPPPFALNKCFGLDDQSIFGLAEIGHLLDSRELEVRPFHGSLYAFLRDDPNHRSIFLANSEPTLKWLEADAPPYWREAWLWITQATCGNAKNLIERPSREWALAFLRAGYPMDRLVNVLSHAERAAFEAFDLAAVVRHRLLKIRVLNADNLQADELAEICCIATALSHDPFVPLILSADLGLLHPRIIPALVAMADESQQAVLVDRAIAELDKRITRNLREEYVGVDRQSELACFLVQVVAASKVNQVSKVLRYARKAANPDPIVAAFAKAARIGGATDFVFEAGKSFKGTHFDRELFNSLCLEGLAPASHFPAKFLKHPAIRCLGLVKGDAIDPAP